MQDIGNGYSISGDKNLLDTGVIHNYLCNESYWAKGIPLDAVKKSIEGSYCMGIYHEGKQVGFARIVTDYATFGWLADVFVLPGHRGKGLSKELMKFIMGMDWVTGIRTFFLGTMDAHGLYEKFGFTLLANPKRYMYIFNPDIYKKGD